MNLRDSPTLRRRRTRAVSLLMLGLCVVSVAGFAGAWHWVLDLASHFRVQYALLLLAALFVGWLCRVRAAVLCLSAGCLAAQLGALLPFLVVSESTPAPAATPSASALRVFLANVYTPNRSFDAMRRLIEHEAPDVVVLQETDQAWLEGLAELRATYPNRVEEARADNFGIAVWSRLKMANARIVRLGHAGVPSVIADIEHGDATLVLIATHPLPPAGRARSELRDEGLAQLARFAASEVSPVLVVGDLNCTPWSPHFRALLRDGRLRDSGEGRWVQATWPSWLGALGIPIDHVLYGAGLRVLRRWVGPAVGSDHRPLIAEVAWVQGA